GGRGAGCPGDGRGGAMCRVLRGGVAGGEPEALTGAPKVRHYLGSEPFSPDGQRLVYAGNDRTETDQDVLVRESATGETRRLVATEGAFFAGPGSPDGGTLCVLEMRSNTDQRLHLVAAGGGELAGIGGDGEAKRDPVGWSADGSRLYLVTDAGRDVEAVAALDPATGELSDVDSSEWGGERAELSGDRRGVGWGGGGGGGPPPPAPGVGARPGPPGAAPPPRGGSRLSAPH